MAHFMTNIGDSDLRKYSIEVEKPNVKVGSNLESKLAKTYFITEIENAQNLGDDKGSASHQSNTS